MELSGQRRGGPSVRIVEEGIIERGKQEAQQLVIAID